MMTLDLSGFSEDISDLSLDTDGDLQDHNTIDSVSIAPQSDPTAVTPCHQDPNKSSAYECGPVKASDKMEVTILATPKDAGNFSPNILWTNGEVGTSGWQEFSGSNSVTGFTETVDS